MLQKSMYTQHNQNGNTDKRKRPNFAEMSDSDYDDNFKTIYNSHQQYLQNQNQNLVNPTQSHQQNQVTETRRTRRKKKIMLYSDSQASEEEEQEQELPDPQIFDPPVESIHSMQTRDGERKFYVKFQSRSFRYCDWLTEDELLNYDPSVKNKLNRFIRDFKTNVVCQDDLFINYDPQYLEIDRVLDCNVIFPIIHPKKGSQIKQKWTYSLLNVVTYLVNFDYEDIFYGIYFLDFSEEIQKFDHENNIDFSIIINRIFLDYYNEPLSFWDDILQVYDNFDHFNYRRQGNDSHILLERMKQITRIIYDQWKEIHFQDYQVIEDFKNKQFSEFEFNNFSKEFSQIFAINKQQKSSLFLEGVLNYINKYQIFVQNKQQIEELVQKIKEKSKLIEEYKKKSESQNSEQEKTSSDKDNNEKINNQDDDENEEEENNTEKNSNIETDHGQIHNEKKILKQLVTNLQMMLNQNIEKFSSLFRKSRLLNLDIIYNHNLKYKKILEEYKDADLSWIEDEEIRNSINIKNPKEIKYLVKWKELSYLECTWENQNFIQNFPEKLRDFKRFNRALVKEQRLDYLERFTKNQELREIYSNTKRLNKQHPIYIFDLKKIVFGTKENNHIFQYSRENQPIYKEHRMLRDYQLDSLNWMVEAWSKQRNVILADEMGLGKTIQAMSYLNHLVTMEKLSGPFLILAPLGTLQHWKRVFQDWSYMNSILYYDRNGKKGRAQCRKLEWYRNDVTKKGNMTQHFKIIKFQVIITSFEVFLQDFETVFQEIPFQHIVIDEAHKLKNKKAKILSVLKQLVCTRILLLTGTPIQNNISELWSLLNFIEPSAFRDLESFKIEYDDLSNMKQLDKLKRQLGPYLLRRMKEDVESSIPPLQETIIDIELTNIQKMVYKTIYEKSKGTLQKGLGLKFVSMMNNLEMQLRKCCNHPYLLQGIKENIIGDIQTNQQYFEKLLSSSGKMIVLDKLMQKFQKENKKILIFSQFTEMLKLIEEYLTIKEIRYEKIDGSTKAQNRQSAIDKFNKRKDKFEVFLLSTKAGGIGINLTSAKIVIIYDSDWNPQNDVQAIARAHRIGQTDKVKVFRLVSKKTYESEMFERASKKLGLDQAIFLTGNLQANLNENNQGEDIQKLKPEEIELLLKKGMLGLLQEESNQNQEQQFNMDIDKVIENARVANYSFTKGSYTFAKSNFDTTSKENKVLLDDPDFWKKVFKGSDTLASKLKKKYNKKIKDGTFKLFDIQKEFLLELGEAIHSYLIDRVKNDGFCAETERGFEELLQKIQDDAQINPQLEIVVSQLEKDFQKKSRRVKKIDEKYFKTIMNRKNKVKKQISSEEDNDNQQQDENSEIYQEENLVKKKNVINKKIYINNNCYICDKDKYDFVCQGECKQQIHKDCLQNLLNQNLSILQKKFPQAQLDKCQQDKTCFLCYNQIHQCYECNQFDLINKNQKNQFQKCRNCNYYYHKYCLPQDLSSIENDEFLCSRHFCHECKKKQEHLYRCINCPISYHKKCMSKKNKLIRKGAIKCYKHKHEKDTEKKSRAKIKKTDKEIEEFYIQKNVVHPSSFDYSITKDPWCRFCGARYSPQFYDSKLGEKTLCEFHYKRNTRQPLRLKESDKPLKPESNTERKYIQII